VRKSAFCKRRHLEKLRTKSQPNFIKAFVILRACTGKEKDAGKWEFVILSAAKDLVAESVIELGETRSFTLFRMTDAHFSALF